MRERELLNKREDERDERMRLREDRRDEFAKAVHYRELLIFGGMISAATIVAAIIGAVCGNDVSVTVR